MKSRVVVNYSRNAAMNYEDRIPSVTALNTRYKYRRRRNFVSPIMHANISSSYVAPSQLSPDSPLHSKRVDVQIKNRRKRYLDAHPSYFLSPALELAHPLLYDRLVRRFQDPSDRAADVAKKGYAGVLEADLWRSEAKMEALRRDSPMKPACSTASPAAGLTKEHITRTESTNNHREDGKFDVDEIDEDPVNKEEGLRMWREEMEIRFLAGFDEDFEYGDVDAGQQDNGSEEEREEEEKWFNDEEESWLEEEERGEENEINLKPVLRGETGVQDF